MRQALTTTYPLWFVTLCLLMGAAYAAILYFRQKDRALFDEMPFLRYVLPLCRFLVVSLLAFFLLEPLLNTRTYNTEKPIVLVALDNSKSMMHWDSTVPEKYRIIQQNIEDELGDKFDLEWVNFGAEVAPGFSGDMDDEETSISGIIDYAAREYRAENLAAALLFTDGIYNAGSDPFYTSGMVPFPLYSVGMGDTTIYTDLKVSNVLHNSIAYLGNDFPVRVEIAASKLKGKQAVLELYKDGKPVQSERISINNDDFYYEADLLVKADKKGPVKLEVRLSEFDDELNKSNNRYSFYLEVVESGKKVEIWSKTPHPDIGAIKSLLQGNDNYLIKVKLGESETFDADKTAADLVILYNWFATDQELNQYEKLRSGDVSVWAILGSRFKPVLFNKGSQPLKFESMGSGVNMAQALINADFEYFEINEELSENIQSWSPLRVPFGTFSGYKPSDVVLHQRIGTVKTPEPLLLMQQGNGPRFACFAGIGSWQWKLLDYEQNGTHRLSAELMQQVVQYLSVRDNKKRLIVEPGKRNYSINETVVLNGELYNQSLQPVTNAEINVEIISEDGNRFKRLMDPGIEQYRLNLDKLAEGSYTFRATTEIGGTSLRETGFFNVLSQQKELIDLRADHQLLRAMADQSGGRFYPMEGLDLLIDMLKDEPSMKAEIREEINLNELISFRWIFWLLLGLLSIEWFSRKMIGTY